MNNLYPMPYSYNNYNDYGTGSLQGFSLSSLTSGGILPLAIIGIAAYFLLSGKGSEVGSFIKKKSVEEQLNKTSAEAAAKTAERDALQALLEAEHKYNEAKDRLKAIRSGKIAISGA